MRNPRTVIAFIIIVVLALALVALQIWATVENTRRVERIAGQLQDLQSEQLPEEKERQEVIALRIENEMRAFFWNSLLTTLGPMVTAFVALVGSLLGLRNYLDARDRERLDRAAVDLRSILENLVSQEPRERAVGVVGLQHYFTSDKKEYHLRSLSALVTAARLEDDSEVLHSIRIAAEQAVSRLPAAILRQVTWQKTQLKGADLSGSNLKRLDLRDADLEDANLSLCDLSHALLTNARLNGAKLNQCDLQGANLAYVDFAGASLVKANLQEADLHHIKVWEMDLDGADLRGAKFEPDQMPWEYVENWRSAIYDPGLLENLLAQYGPAPHGVRTLMLMWEIPPLVAGGTWTASYHMVRNLRHRGADLSVIVPWEEGAILPSPFGCEVEVVPLGITAPLASVSPYANSWDAMQSWSPYGSLRFQPYTPSSYSAASLYSPYGYIPSPYTSYPSSYATSQTSTMDLHGRSSLLRLIDEFSERFVGHAAKEPFDLIHAHDWVTFDAAAAAAQKAGKPWIAHFHSTERDRRPNAPDPIIERIERRGTHLAAHIVTPSTFTARRVQELYNVPEDKITVVPNQLSQEKLDLSDMGSFESKKTIFLGRLTSQKGPDRFAQVAAEVRRRQGPWPFLVFGAGEEQPQLQYNYDILLSGAVDWDARGQAFSKASAVLVPSRSEPFGMVILEAMQHHVPVLYPEHAGVAEVIESGIRIQPEDIAGTAQKLERVLTDWTYWEEIVQQQSEEIAAYPERGYEQQVLKLWESLRGGNSPS